MRLAVYRVLVGMVALGAWEATSRFMGLGFWFSSPIAVAERIYELAVSGDLATHAAVTLSETFAGLISGCILGIATGFLFGRYRTLGEVLDPYMMFLNSLPRVALGPIFILWFGIGLFSKIVTAFSLVYFIMLINTYGGVRAVDRDLVRVTRLLGGKGWRLTQKVVVPSSLPWIFAGLRLSVAYAFTGAVVGEFVGATAGLGWYIVWSSGMFDTTGIVTGVVLLGIVSTFLIELFRRLENRLLRWRPVEGLT